ncbi:MAG: HtaA domain-containing protein [Solirubrobacterales bacterium]
MLLTALVAVTALLGPATSGMAATPEPLTACPVDPDGNTRIGNAELTTKRATWKKLNRAGLTQRYVAPAAWEGGVPVFPVNSNDGAGETVSVGLSGGFTVSGGKNRKVKVALTRFVRRPTGKAWIEGRSSSGSLRLFRVVGTTVAWKTGALTGATVSGGRTELLAGFARDLRKRTGLATRQGMAWGGFYLDWTDPVEPDVTPPQAPPDFPRPAGATELVGGTITWNVRQSWVQYVASGDAPSAIGGAVPAPAVTVPGQPPLVYSFTFPFVSGWVDGGPGPGLSASTKGSGGVYFRYCGSQNVYKGINFTVTAPEVELNGTNSRLVFTVKGIDGTPFSPGRAVVVDLRPDSVTPVTTGSTTTWTGIPGSVPAGSTGVFGGFYAPGAEFGSVDLTIRRGP